MSLLFIYEFNMKAAGIVTLIPVNHFSIRKGWTFVGITKYLSHPVFFKTVLIPVRNVFKFITHQYINLSFFLIAFLIFLLINQSLIIFTIDPTFFLLLFQIHKPTTHEKIFLCDHLFSLKIKFFYFLSKNC